MILTKQHNILALLVLVAACDESEQIVEHELSNPGIACIVPDAQPGQQLSILITQTCVTGSRLDLDTECSVDVADGNVLVDATYRFETGEHATLDCENVTTTCSTLLPIDTGNYSLVYGDQHIEFLVPPYGTDEPPVCSGELLDITDVDPTLIE